MIERSLTHIAAALAAGEISSQELTRTYLDRIARLNPELKAFITVDAEGAMAQAATADAARAAGQGGVLTGVPIAHKDLFCTEGLLTTCGSKMLENFVSPYDATVVSRLKAAGTVILGKTNCDEFAMGSTNESSYFGATRNPWDVSRVPGGSSGGSAAAVAARLAPAVTGTDTGGSIRQPASLCGVTGLKPTYGAVSRWGMIAYASSLDQGGPFAQSAEDCALMLNAFAGFDEKDSTSAQRETEDYLRELRRAPADPARPLAGVRLGVPREYFGEGLAEDVRSAIEAAIVEMEKLGAVRVEVSLPKTELAIPAYYVIAPAEASSNLSRFDGVRYGHRAAQYRDLMEMYCKSRAEGFGREVQRRIMVGTYVLSHGYYDAYYIKALQLRRLIADDFQAALSQCDVLLGPAAPTVAWKLGAMADDPVQMYLADIYTVSVNLAGLPALSVPCGFGEGGMPVGLQMIGNYFDEARMLAIAHRFQQATDWHTRSPAL
ncbi:Asp-tRNA(Asn)/Glu-tRNA(Gln) amidotransferase subunit GatA [Niveibacterium sp. SC-1]|uniref:Asp-tRNA(Asn)/Glu-tRNA(Gln) amidotransferase subunit GatA n=1 Tax=Niveibacterium sp. SC-1 TaxID=3135646 RepID=UPI00311FEA31